MNYTTLKTPGVYVNEVSIFPPSVAQVPTAIPAFVGYTEKHQDVNGDSLQNKPKKISSMVDFVLYYGGAPKLLFDATTGNGVELDVNTNQVVKANNKQNYYLFDSMQMYFANGGGDCYVVSVNKYVEPAGTVDFTAMENGVNVLKEVDEPTMIVFPDGVSMGSNLYKLQQAAMKQCGELMDRVGVFDIMKAEDRSSHDAKVKEFRDSIGMSNLKYAAAYTPWLKVGIQKNAKYRDIKGQIVKAGAGVPVSLSTLVKNFPPAEDATIKGLLTTLDQLVSDNNFIGKRISDFLKKGNAQFSKYAPENMVAPTPTDLPSLQQGFDLLVQSVNNKIAAADAAPTAVNVDAASDELIKMLWQVYNLTFMLDDFGINSANFVQNQKVLENVWTSMSFTAPFTGLGAAPGDNLPAGVFLNKITELAKWDGTLADAATKAVSDTPAAATIQSQAPFAGTYELFNLVAASVDTAILAVAAPGASEPNRLLNQKAAISKIKDLFTYFYSIVSGIEAFAASLEKITEESLLAAWPVYKNIIDGINNNMSLLPPSGAMAGIYARVDNERGVWKAPANVSVTYANGTLINITDAMQESLNVDVDAGKSINAIRVFSGKGTMVWGARTLAGNDNEWRYVPVRRFFNMVEESVKKSTAWAVFEPNDANTWVKVKSMIDNFLTLQWRAGALAGAKPEEAFFVRVGLNQTMTFVDILEGRMIVQIGMAVVRPAEFIVLEFSHKVQTS
jgi:uncharacterized protein